MIYRINNNTDPLSYVILCMADLMVFLSLCNDCRFPVILSRSCIMKNKKHAMLTLTVPQGNVRIIIPHKSLQDFSFPEIHRNTASVTEMSGDHKNVRKQ